MPLCKDLQSGILCILLAYHSEKKLIKNDFSVNDYPFGVYAVTKTKATKQQ